MNESKTIQTINKYYGLLENEEQHTPDNKFFIMNIELELAKSIIQEFGEKSAKKLGHILLVAAE